MRCIAAALAIALFASLTCSAGAQDYSGATPVPRTTSLPALHALALAREMHERFSRGIDALQRADWQSAASEFERIVALRPPQPQLSTAQYDLGIAYARGDRLNDAAAQFNAAIAGDPGFLAAMANLISVDLARGDISRARAVADRFVAAAPQSARALYSRGITALRQNDFATARGDFSQLLRNEPQYALAHYNLGLAETRLGDFPLAEQELQTAVELAPAYARARFALGTVFLHEGKRAQARDAFARVVRDANGDLALQNLALAMRDAIHAP